VEKWPNQPCLAHRQSQGSGYGPYESITYAEVADMVARAASGLFSLGMAPKQRLGIFGVNCVEWMVSLQVGQLPANQQHSVCCLGCSSALCPAQGTDPR
jgi:long-chain acyl-CoA synthetase